MFNGVCSVVKKEFQSVILVYRTPIFFFDFLLFLLFSCRFYIMNREEQIGGEKVR